MINANARVQYEAFLVNHISDEMLQAAPKEEDVYPRFIEFLGDAINGDILMCAHNANFDFNFLRSTFSRLGYEANIKYIDTLWLARRCIDGLPNYKQGTLEKYYGLKNNESHRAGSDAENCGEILCRLLARVDKIFEEDRQQEEYNLWLKNAYEYWSQGEAARKNGRFDEAFNLYDKAKAAAPAPWFLYEGYAKAYRKLGDYESELRVLDEGIRSLGPDRSTQLIGRRDKLMERMAAAEKSEQASLEKALEKERKAAERLKELEMKAREPKKAAGKAIIQMDDDGTVVGEYDSISAAERETGVSSKSIRCAANGTQKHAGGYCWRYKQ